MTDAILSNSNTARAQFMKELVAEKTEEGEWPQLRRLDKEMKFGDGRVERTSPILGPPFFVKHIHARKCF